MLEVGEFVGDGVANVLGSKVGKARGHGRQVMRVSDRVDVAEIGRHAVLSLLLRGELHSRCERAFGVVDGLDEGVVAFVLRGGRFRGVPSEAGI